MYYVLFIDLVTRQVATSSNLPKTLNMSQVASSHWGVPFVQAFTKNTVLAANNAMRAANISGDLDMILNNIIYSI